MMLPESISSRLVVGPVPEHRPDLGPCWLWTGHVNNWGYGRVGNRYVHRVVAEAILGRPLAPLERPDHLCRVRHCGRPEHLEVVTHGENIRRGKALTPKPVVCPHGHAYADHGRLRRNGSMDCRACDRARPSRYRRRVPS